MTQLQTLQTTYSLVLKKHVTQTSSNNESKKHATQTEFHMPSPTLHLNKNDKMLYVPLQFDKYKNHALLDTGAVQRAMSETENISASRHHIRRQTSRLCQWNTWTWSSYTQTRRKLW